jgi:hypothetical protein
MPSEEKKIAGKTVHSIGAGTLLVCFAPKITAAEVEPLALGIVAWHKELALRARRASSSVTAPSPWPPRRGRCRQATM